MEPRSHYQKADHHLSARLPFRIFVYREVPKREAPLPDIHHDFHLGILLKGRNRVIYPEYSRENRPGEVWWTSCWEPHTGPVLENQSALLLITISPESLGNIDVFGELFWAAPFLAPPAQRPQPRGRTERETVLKFAVELEALNARAAEQGRLRTWLKIHELILFLCRDWTAKGADGRPGSAQDFLRILPAIERIRSDLARAVALDEAASVCGLSRSRFSNLFRAVMGDSFGKFALRTRLSGAMRELGATSKLIKAIGTDWGFADKAHFAHAFRRQFGCSPTAFREQAGGRSGTARSQAAAAPGVPVEGPC